MMSESALTERYARRRGEKVGMLTFQGLSSCRSDRNRVLGQFVCECGNSVVLAAGRTLNGHKRTHCGCQTDRNAPKTHGMRYSPEYSSWQAMKARCLDPSNKDYPRWGGKGITVYQPWIDSFSSFFEHVGKRPPGTSIDRIHNELGYEPGNVRWATPTEQQRNRSTTFRWHICGKSFETHSEAARHFGVSDHTVWRWVNGQWDNRRNTFTAPRENCYVTPRY